jgi:hypothetical protein
MGHHGHPNLEGYIMAELAEKVCRITDTGPPIPEGIFWPWGSFCPGVLTFSAEAAGEGQGFWKVWAEVCIEATKKMGEALQTQFSAGLKAIEERLHLTALKGPEDLCTRLPASWEKMLACLRPLAEISMQAVYFTEALGRHVAGGMKMVGEEVYRQRLAVCAGCDFFRDNHCVQCGCRMAGDVIAKARWASEECPLGKWPVSREPFAREARA